MLKLRFSDIGFLRLALFVLTGVSLLLVPEPATPTILTWPQIVPTLLAPALAPLILMVILLDLMMAKIMSAGTDKADERPRFKKIMLLDLIAAALMLWAWLPFFLSLGR